MTLTDTRPIAHLCEPVDNDSSIGTQLAYLVAKLLDQHPSVDLPTIRLDVVPINDWPHATIDARLGTLTDECPSCHAIAGHPHTDYCQLTRQGPRPLCTDGPCDHEYADQCGIRCDHTHP